MYQVNRFRMYLILFAALFLQCTLVRYVAVGGIRPDLVILCVIFFGLFFGRSTGLEAGLVAGCVVDILGLDIFAMTMFIYGLTGFAAGLVNRQFSKDSPLSRAIIVWGLTALAALAHFFLSAALVPSRYGSLPFGEYVSYAVVPVATLTALFSCIIYPQLVSWLASRPTEEYL